MSVGDGFNAMAQSGSKFAQTLGQIGQFAMKNPLLMVIALLVGAFLTLYTTNEKFRDSINNIMGPALEALGDMFQRIMVAVEPLIKVIGDLFTLLFGGTDGGGGPLAKVLELIATVLAKIIGILAPIIANIVEILAPILTKIFEIITPIVEIVMLLVEKYIMLLMVYWGTIFDIVGKLVGILMNLLMPVIQSVLDYLMPLMDIWVNIINLVAAFFEALFSGDWQKFGDLFRTIGQDIVQSLADMFTGFINIIIELLNLMFKIAINHPLIGFIADVVEALSGGTINVIPGKSFGLFSLLVIASMLSP
jgi:phage-related protein